MTGSRAPDVVVRRPAARPLRHAPRRDVPSLVVLPTGDSVGVAISAQLGEETVTRT